METRKLKKLLREMLQKNENEEVADIQAKPRVCNNCNNTDIEFLNVDKTLRDESERSD